MATLAYLHGRRLYLNMLAGGFRTDLLALDDPTPHDERYERTIEYTQIISGLIAGESVTHKGRHYSVSNLNLAPALPEELRPGFLISGSSPAGLDAAQRTGATAVKYPKRTSEEQDQADEGSGIRVGIVTRESSEDAWAVARERFPEDRKGQLTQKLAMKVSDSHWHRQLADMARDEDEQGHSEEPDADPYWLWPFENYATFCPYLVGSYERVARGAASATSISAFAASSSISRPQRRSSNTSVWSSTASAQASHEHAQSDGQHRRHPSAHERGAERGCTAARARLQRKRIVGDRDGRSDGIAEAHLRAARAREQSPCPHVDRPGGGAR